MQARSKRRLTRFRQHVEDLASDDVRRAARAHCLIARFYAKDFEPELIEAAGSSDPDISWRSVSALTQVRSTRVFPFICANLHREELRVKYEAALDLGHLGDPRGIPVLIEFLLNPETDQMLDIPISVGLYEFGDLALDSLDRVIKSDTSWRRFTAGQTIAMIGSERAMALLASYAESDELALQAVAKDAYWTHENWYRDDPR